MWSYIEFFLIFLYCVGYNIFLFTWIYFILLQAVTKNERKFHLSKVNNLNVKNYIQKLKHLCLLPSTEIARTFYRISDALLSSVNREDPFANDLAGFVNYYENQWIKRTKAEDFSVYLSIHRTNNLLERFNRTLHTYVETRSSPVHFLGKFE